jgi:YHS domain-containing protein
MKFIRLVTATVALGALMAAPVVVNAGDAKAEKPKPYPLKTCVVSDEEIGGGDMKPYVWVYKGQEIKMCCKDCKKDFEKEPEKYMKKIAEAAKKSEKK